MTLPDSIFVLFISSTNNRLYSALSDGPFRLTRDFSAQLLLRALVTEDGLAFRCDTVVAVAETNKNKEQRWIRPIWKPIFIHLSKHRDSRCENCQSKTRAKGFSSPDVSARLYFFLLAWNADRENVVCDFNFGLFKLFLRWTESWNELSEHRYNRGFDFYE